MISVTDLADFGACATCCDHSSSSAPLWLSRWFCLEIKTKFGLMLKGVLVTVGSVPSGTIIECQCIIPVLSQAMTPVHTVFTFPVYYLTC